MPASRPAVILAATIALLARFAAAQTTVPVLIEGDPANRLDVVFLGDGYTVDQMSQFAADTAAVAAGLLAAAPFAEYRTYFNIWRIEVASNESGASHPNVGITRDTAFGAYYNCGGVERLICLNTAKVNTVLMTVPANP